MALRVLKGGVMTSSKNIQICINILSLCIHQQKTRSPNAEFFFIASYMFSRVFRGLNGSLDYSDGELWPAAVRGGIHPRLAYLGAKFWPFLGFWVIILDPDMLVSQSRALTTRFRVRNPKNIERKNVALAWGPVPGKVGLKWPKHALIVT